LGIRDATLNGSEQDVCVDTNDQLGPCSESSLRFKENVRDMGESSAELFGLRPVLFRYRPEIKSAAPPRSFGLIAEEVAEVYPELVSFDREGKPLAVRYDLLSSLLLNELKRQDDRIEQLARRLADLESPD